jgi:hypothetical protein
MNVAVRAKVSQVTGEHVIWPARVARCTGGPVKRLLIIASVAALGLAACGGGSTPQPRATQAAQGGVGPGCSSETCETEYALLLTRALESGNSPQGESPNTWCISQIIEINMASQSKLYPGGFGATYRIACLLAVKRAES